MVHAGRDVCSYTLGEVAGMSALDLAARAIQAEEKSSALWREHMDTEGRVPPDVEARSRHLSRVSEIFGILAHSEQSS